MRTRAFPSGDFTIREAADLHRVSTKTIRRWIQAGYIRAYRIGPRMLRLERDSVINARHWL